MPHNWKKYKLGDLVSANEKSVETNIHFINYFDIQSVKEGKYEQPRQLELKKAPSRARRVLTNGDTVISTVRPNLKSFFYAQNLPENSIGSTGFVVLTPKKINSRFLYYLTTNNAYVDYLINSCTGSADPAFSPQVILDSQVLIPESKIEQQAIAEILSALDDKIELNLQMNKTLEEMANALYKHWFVDFGPFKNEKFVESELGMIPEGWSIKPYYSIAQYINGTSIKQTQFSAPFKGRPIIKIAELKQGVTSQTGWTDKEFDEKYYVNQSDLLFSWSGNPHTSIDIFIWDKSPGILNQHIFKVIPNPDLNKSFIYFTIKFYKQLFVTLATRKQTTGLGHFTIDDLKNNFVIIPSNKALEEFSKIAVTQFELLYNNLVEIQNLKQTRDYLLPKLISGEIRVKDAEKKIKAIV